MNIGDLIDKIITLILGIVVILIGLKPSHFSKNKNAIEKMRKIKFLFIIIGSVLICLSIIQLILIIIK